MTVVERGTARCPKCMSLADYHFREIDGGLVRYEVSCQPCGSAYFEEFTAVPVDLSAA